MLARLRKSVTKKRRQLFNASVYAAYVMIADANLIKLAAGGQLNEVEITLITLGLVDLNAAIGDSLGRAIQAVAEENQAAARAANGNHQAENIQHCIRESTHTALNSWAHILSTLKFGALDMLYLTGGIPRNPNTSYAGVATRLTGTVSWNLGAWTMFYHAIAHDRKKENHPEATVRALRIHASIYDLTIQVLFLIAAFCYLAQRYSDREINPFGASNVFLWLLANTIGLVDAAYDVYHRNDDLPPEVVINLPPEQTPRVEVLDDDAEEASSEVVLESPGSNFRH